MAKDSQKIKCKYVFKDDYNPEYVNGLIGGVGTKGEIILNCFLERHPIPYSQTFNLVSGGYGDEIMEERDPNDSESDLTVVRIVKSGLVLNYSTAKEFHKWLGVQIETLEKLQNNE